jgi:hypothetical protein
MASYRPFLIIAQNVSNEFLADDAAIIIVGFSRIKLKLVFHFGFIPTDKTGDKIPDLVH